MLHEFKTRCVYWSFRSLVTGWNIATYRPDSKTLFFDDKASFEVISNISFREPFIPHFLVLCVLRSVHSETAYKYKRSQSNMPFCASGDLLSYFPNVTYRGISDDY